LLTLVHVSDTAPTQVYGGDTYDEHTRADEQYLASIAEEVRQMGVVVEIALPHGDPVKELAAFVSSHGADLLVMGSHGHRLLGDILLGQTVDPVRHRVDIPVFVAR
jgi:manganese transport protein